MPDYHLEMKNNICTFAHRIKYDEDKEYEA